MGFRSYKFYHSSAKMSRFLLPLAFLLVAVNCINIPFNDQFEPKAEADVKPKANVTYRLPGIVDPQNYQITLTPELHAGFSYKGVSLITVKITNATKSITLHSKGLQFGKIAVTLNSKDLTVKHTEKEENDFLILETTEEIPKDSTVVINIEYYGVLNDTSLRGFYRSSYINDDKEKRWLALTHFEPTGARLAFPCFDEPALKATFDITIDLTKLIDPNSYKAISNMPLKSDTGNVYKFETTPKMSTYLVAFVISDFTSKSQSKPNEIKYAVYAKNDILKDTDYALDKSVAILQKLQTYVGVNYQLKKMDNVGVPDFSAGAMENWGLVIYKQNALTYNKTTSSEKKKQSVAGIIAHEYAHQWFGNHVSPKWWTYLWLNEGFAAFFQHFITDEVEPTFKMRDQFVVDNLQDSAFSFDVSAKTHKMNADVESPEQIRNIFDTVSYDKSASIIRMMQHFITEEKFKAGLTLYLNDFKNGVASSDDLFQRLNEKWKGEGLILKDVMGTWVNQPGYPVITVTRNYKTKKAEISQQRFLLQKSKEASTEKWTIPINYASEANVLEDFKTTTAAHWLKFDQKDNKMEVDLEKVDPKHWVIFNKLQTGYYRVNYDEDNWRLIIKYLTAKAENINNINYLNRAQLLDDAWQLARAGLLNYQIAFDLTNYLAQEVDYFPWVSAIRNLDYLKEQLTLTPHLENFKKYALKISSKLIDDVKFQQVDNDDHIKVLKRGLAVKWACSLGHKNCTTELEKPFSAWKSDAATNPINPNLKSTVLCVNLGNADEKNWNAVFDIYQKTEDLTEKTTILEALACSRNEKILNNFLNLALQEDSKIHELSTAIKSVYKAHEIGLNVSMHFIFKNVYKIMDHDKGSSSIVTYLKDMCKKFTKDEQLDALKKNIADISLENKDLDSAMESAKENIEWVKKNVNTIGTLLVEKTKDNNSATSMKFAIFCLIPVFLSLFA